MDTAFRYSGNHDSVAEGQNQALPARRPHPLNVLTAVRVRSLKKPGRYADGNGLYLVVDPSCAKRWMLRTVVRGRRRDIGLGGLRLVSLAEAREQAARLRRIARQGGDPLAERRQRKVPTWEEAAREVHRSRAETFRSTKHAAQWIGSLERHVFPVFGSLRLDQIESGDVLKALSPIWLSKPETARRVRQRIRTVMDWAKAKNFRSGENPVEGTIEALPRNRRRGDGNHFPSMPYPQVPGFIRELRDAGGSMVIRLALEFLILTATRTSEVLLAQWDEVDLETRTWTIPAKRMKAERVHRVPLAPRCVETLEQLRQWSDGGPYVFPSRRAGRPLSFRVFYVVLQRMKRTDCTAHGFRSSFRVWSAECTPYSRAVCEAALAHTLKDRVEAAYRRTDLFERRRRLMEQWAEFLSGESREPQVVLSHR